MKQFVFLLAMFAAGTTGSMAHPFWGLLLYYTLAVLRPQYMWDWALPEWRWSLAAAAVVLLGCAMNFPRTLLRGRLNLVTAFMLIYGFLLIMSCLTAHDPAVAQTWGIEYGKIMLMALIASLVIDRVWQVQALALTVLVTLGYVAYEINYLYFVNGRLDIFHYGYGGLDNNGAGLLLAMGVPFAAAFGVAAPKRWQRCAAWVLGLFMLHAMMMSYSRGAMLATLVGAAWMLLHHRSPKRAAVIAAVAVIAVSFLAGPEIRKRFLSTGDYERDNSAQSRIDSWAAAWEIAWDYPLTGQGIRNSNKFSHNYGADNQGRTIHSQYLQIAADSGIPAMLTYIALVLTSGMWLGEARRRCMVYMRKQPHDSEPDRRIVQADQVLLAFQSSLLIFAFGGAFLSLEVFELPWLLMAIAGLAPAAVSRELKMIESHASPASHAPAPAPATPRRDAPGLPLSAKRWAHP